jgi:glycosyltransferase involved in cell wall biosynthesis
VSGAVAEAHVAARTIQRRKTTVIENGVDVQRFARPADADLSQLRERLGITPNQRVLLCVGRLAAAKNHALLLRVFAKLYKRVPNACLLLAGGGPLEAQLRAQAAELDITAGVIFAGTIDPIAPLFHLAEVFVLASSYEGLPMVVLEAMASGAAIVCTSVGGIPEVIANGESGLLVPSDDELALESALRGLLEGPENERRRLGDRAKADAIAKFSTERMVERTANLYRSLAVRTRN